MANEWFPPTGPPLTITVVESPAGPPKVVLYDGRGKPLAQVKEERRIGFATRRQEKPDAT